MTPPNLTETPNPLMQGCLGRDEQCPLCGGDNQCRVAKGNLYKGPCWCQKLVVPKQLLDRLAEAWLEPACLCRPCLESLAEFSGRFDEMDTVIAEVHKSLAQRRPEADERDSYLDKNGNTVFTAAYHLRRGNCCQSGCRHCPY